MALSLTPKIFPIFVNGNLSTKINFSNSSFETSNFLDFLNLSFLLSKDSYELRACWSRRRGTIPQTFTLAKWRSTNWATSAFFGDGRIWTFTHQFLKLIALPISTHLRLGMRGFEPLLNGFLDHCLYRSLGYIPVLPSRGFEPLTTDSYSVMIIRFTKRASLSLARVELA